MKKGKLINIFLVIILLFCTFYLTGCSNEDDEMNIKSKATQEIRFIDNSIVSILNSFNNISYLNYTISSREIQTTNTQTSTGDSSSGTESSGGQDSSQSNNEKLVVSTVIPNSILTNSNNKINWSNIKQETEKLYSIWNNALIDLHTLNVNNDDLLLFNNKLDKATTHIKSENKANSMASLVELYSLIPVYLKQYSDDNKKNNIVTTKANILSSYALLETSNWTEASKYLDEAEKSFNYLVNNPLDNIENQNSISKSYVLIKELQNSVKMKDKDIFYINYKNIMQELESL